MALSSEQLDRDAAVMLYVAGEMPDAEREAFERRLAGEPELAAEAERVRAAQSSLAAALAEADAHTRLPASEAVVVRRVSRSTRDWLRRRAQEDEVIPPAPLIRPFPWWWYPAAAAAALIVAFLVWSSRQEVGPMEPTAELQREMQAIEAEQAELADWLTDSLDATADASSLDADVERLLTAASGAEDLNSLLWPPEEVSQ